MPKAADDFLSDVVSPHDAPPPQASSPASSASSFLSDTASPHEIPFEVRSAPSMSVLDYPAFLGSEALKGAGFALGIPGTIERSLFPSEPNIFPTSGQILEATGRMGLTQQAGLQPSNLFERTTGGFASGVGAAAPLALSGAALPTLLSGGASGGTEALAEGAGLPKSVSEGLGTVAGLGTNLASTLPRASATAAAQEFADAGLPLRSAAFTTEKAGVRSLLGAGAPIEKTEQDLGEAVERVASRLSPSRTYQDAGNKVQELAREWINPVRAADGSVPPNSFPSLEKAAWAPLDAKIPSSTLTPQENFEDLLKEMTSRGGVNKDLVQTTMPDIVQKYNEAIKRRGPTGYGQMDASGTWPRAATPTWGDATALRSAIGDAMRNPSIVSRVGPDTLDSLYAALSKDLRSTAERAGALPEFNSALQTSNELRNFKDQVLGKIVHSDTGARENIMPEQAAKNVLSTLRTGDTSFQLLRHYLPAAADELGGLHLRQIALARPQDVGSTINPSFGKNLQALEAAGSLPSILPQEADLRAVRAAGSISDKVQTVKAMPDRAAKAGLVLGQAGSSMGEAAVGALMAHRYDISGTGDPIYNLLLGGAVGGVAGRYAPAAYSMGRNVLANSVLAARYAGVEKPGLFSQALPTSVAGSLAAGLPPSAP